jgi:processive 1,2-diacylglycerol beta-glucosyltransferase
MLVAKPGGLTMSEAMGVGCPFVIYEPFLIPGQEQKNAAFLVDHGIGLSAATPSALRSTVQHLLDDTDHLEKLRMNALANGKPYAAREILQKVLELDRVSAPV